MESLSFFWPLVLTALLLILALKSITIIRQQNIGVVETLGKFSGILPPGLHFVVPVLQTVAARVDLRVQEVKGEIEIKTKDNVFVKLPVALMIQVIPDAADKAHYLLAGASEPGPHGSGQYTLVATWALNALRAAAASLTLEQMYEDRERLTTEVKLNIDKKMRDYGFHVVDVLIDQPTVSAEVQTSFNRVVASQREREAAEQQAQANRVRIVGAATAEAEAQELRAQGVSKARAILASGFTQAMAQARESGVNEHEVLQLLLETNRLDTIRYAAEHGKPVILDVRSPVNLQVGA